MLIQPERTHQPLLDAAANVGRSSVGADRKIGKGDHLPEIDRPLVAASRTVDRPGRFGTAGPAGPSHRIIAGARVASLEVHEDEGLAVPPPEGLHFLQRAESAHCDCRSALAVDLAHHVADEDVPALALPARIACAVCSSSAPDVALLT